MDVRELHARFVQEVSEIVLGSNPLLDVIKHVDESHTGSSSPPSSWYKEAVPLSILYLFGVGAK